MTRTTKHPEPMLWLSDACGIYIPRYFANSFKDRAKHVSGVTGQQWDILEDGPDNPLYWDVWNEVLDSATVTDENGATYHLWQDGDLWLIPSDMTWDDDQGFYVWPAESVED